MHCTKSQIFKFAHAQARKIVANTGCSYASALSQGAKQAWEAAKAPRDTHLAKILATTFIDRLAERMMQLKKKFVNPVTGEVIVIFSRPGSKEEFVFSNNGVSSYFIAQEAGNPTKPTRPKFCFDSQQQSSVIRMALIDFLRK